MKTKSLNFKYTWVQNGVIFTKKDESSDKIKISSDSDLIKFK